ncbi:hypothetical protein DL771_006004 [Monosporascus sp. 5C6A]|nr:hypothetical protein DL771_006004 [Monosporascus sp. 5C6A]
MHKRYSPVVRINPDEVYFADTEFPDTLYPAGGRKTEKPSGTTTPSKLILLHGQHHKFKHIMKEHLAKLLSRLDVSARENEVVKIHELLKAISHLITMYAFDDSFKFLYNARLRQVLPRGHRQLLPPHPRLLRHPLAVPTDPEFAPLAFSISVPRIERARGLNAVLYERLTYPDELRKLKAELVDI